MAAVPLITARQRSYRWDVASVDAPTEAYVEPEQVPTPAPMPARRAAKKTAGAEAAPEPVKAPALDRTVNTPADEPAPKAIAVETTAKADVPEATPVTITGCLELDEQTFRLKDASGLDAPKSRSWRSGFLKKRPVSIALVDATNMLKLSEYVGHRVAATGVLVNRELRARALQRVAASCN